MKKWLYHAEEKAKIIDTDECDIADYYAAGWRDSPADLDSPAPVRKVEKTEETKIQAALVGEEEQAAPAGEEEELDDEAEERASALLLQFKRDPASLTKDEHVELGAALGIQLMKAWKEQTMINKINEVLTDGNAQATA